MKLLIGMLVIASLAVAPLVDEAEFFSSELERFPRAAPGEFATPDSVVREFFVGIFSNQVGRTFKCFPLRERYAALAFEREVARLTVYSPTTTPVPGDHYSRFVSVLESHNKFVRFYRLFFLARTGPEAQRALASVNDEGFTGKEVDPKWIKQMAEILDLGKLSAYSIKDISSEACKVKVGQCGGIAVSDQAVVRIVIVKGDVEITQEFLVAKVSGNYQIMASLSYPNL